MGELDSYPASTSHLKRWVAASRSDYIRIERIFHERSLRKVVQEKTGIESNEEALAIARTCPLTIDKQNDVLIWFVRSLLDIMSAHQFDFRIADTTLAYYRRFYLRECVVRYPPNLYLFTAMIVAIKCENAVVENRCPTQLFSGTGKATAFHEALEFEAILSQTIQFDFFILHGDAPITHYINSYYGFRKKDNRLSVPTVGWPGPKKRVVKTAKRKASTPEEGKTANPEPSVPAEKSAENGETAEEQAPNAASSDDEDVEVEVKMTDEQIFVQWLTSLQQACEKCYLQLYAGNTHFVFRPAEVAAGVFMHVGKQVFELTDMDEFMAAVLPPQIRGDETRTKNVLRIIALTAHEAFKQDAIMAQYDTDHWKPKIQEYLKEARKWTRQLDKKRKLADPQSEPASKRSKVE